MARARGDWHAWYRGYDDPASPLSRRLEEVRRQVAIRLGTMSVRRVLSLCAGDGRDLLPLLAALAPRVPALLVELDPRLARRAQTSAADLGLEAVEVRIAGAGTTDAVRGWGPVDLLLLCGLLDHVSVEDRETTVATLPHLLAPGGHVIWTQGEAVPAELVRRAFARAGFDEVALVRSEPGHRVGVHRLAVPPQPWRARQRMFTFVDG